MSRSRVYSISGFYHLIIRGNCKQVIFEEDHDREFFLNRLAHYREKAGVTICAYCLMENHVHLLVYDPKRQKAQLMQWLESCYACYFNDKYDRSGHLFQDRYLCEAIDSEKYLLTAFRYILNNPAHAGICAADRYRWSSYHCYFEATPAVVNLDPIRPLLGNADAYRRFVLSPCNEPCMEYDVPWRGDNWAQHILQQKLGIENGHELLTYSRPKRNDAILLLRKEGLSAGQIERMTGIGRGIIQAVKY